MVATPFIRTIQLMNKSKCVAVLSDAHGNVEALKLGLDIAKKNGARDIVYLGDSLGYIPSVDAVELLRTSSEDIRFIKGNHEEALLNFNKKKESDEITKHSIIRKLLSKQQIEFIGTWEEKISLDHKSGRIIFLHGSPTDPLNGYLYKDSKISDIKEYLDCKVLFVGNTHIPFIKRIQNTVIVNVGSVGLPRDHGKMGSLAVINFDRKRVKIVRYSIGDIQEKLKSIYGGLIHDEVIGVFDRVSTYKTIEEFRLD